MDRELVIVLTIFGGVLLALILGVYFFDKNISCPRFGESVERPYKYTLIGGGCFVRDLDGRWVQKDNYWNSPSK